MNINKAKIVRENITVSSEMKYNSSIIDVMYNMILNLKALGFEEEKIERCFDYKYIMHKKFEPYLTLKENKDEK